VASDDPMALAFFASTTMDEAFARLGALFTKDGLAFLREFYRHFQDRLQPLLAESTDFTSIIHLT